MNKEEQQERKDELAFETEKLELERERLAFEKERIEEKAARLEELEAHLEASKGKSVSIEPAVAAAGLAIALALGGALGAAVGFDIGKSRVPPPRKVLISRSFIAAMRSVSGVRLHEFAQDDETSAPWMPRPKTEFPEDIVNVR